MFKGEIDASSLTTFIEKDPGLEQTKRRTWTLCILRRLRNSLAKLITAWYAFDSEQSSCFDLDIPGALADKFRQKFSLMRGNIAELRGLHMALEQQIESLEKVSDAVGLPAFDKMPKLIIAAGKRIGTLGEHHRDKSRQ